MKPIELTMYGFMTYKNKTHIDFTKLYPSRIFVISGDTGSGKTSIFDAISFALFGAISRPGVDQIDLRSDFLTIEDPPTYVNYIFEVDGRTYEIERKPHQYAKKKIKAGVKIDHEVELYEIKKEEKILLSDRIKEVDQLVKKIVGLDQNQLKKVMLLAQGEFSEFLSADSASKADLLSDIFQTSLYGDIQEALKDMASSYGNDLDILDQNLDDLLKKNEMIYEKIDQTDRLRHDFSLINKIIGEEIQRKEDSIKDLDSKYKEKNKAKEDLLRRISRLEQENEQIITYKNLESEKENLEKNLGHYKALKENLEATKKAKSVEPYYQRLGQIEDEKNKLTKTIEKKESEKAKVKEELLILEKKKEELPKLVKKLDEDKISLSSYMDKEKSLEKFSQIKKSYDKSISHKLRHEKVEESLENLRKREKKVSDELIRYSDQKLALKDDISNLLIEKQEDKSKLKNNQDLMDRVSENLKTLKEIETLEKDQEERETNLKTAKKDLDLALANQENIEKEKFIKILNEDHICPICGTFHEQKIEEKEIFDLDLESLRETYHELKGKKDLIENKIKLLSERLVKDLPEISDLEKDRKNLEDKISMVDQKLLEKKKDLEKVEKSVDDLIAEKNTLEKEIGQKIQELDMLKMKLSSFDQIEKTYLSMKDSFLELDQEEIREKIVFHRESIENKSSYIEKTNQAYNDTDKKITEIEAFLQTTRSNLLLNEKAYRESRDLFDKKIEEYFDSEEDFIQRLYSYEKLIDQKEAIEEFFDCLKTVSIKLDSLKIYRDRNPVDLDSFKKDLKDLNEDIDLVASSLTKENIDLADLKAMAVEVKDIEKSYSEKSSDTGILKRLAKIASGGDGAVVGREKLDFETFVLIYYFEKILAYSNKRLYKMSNGQYRMIRKTSSGDMRSKQGLDIEIIDANTGKTRPASTLSGGETFLASLSLALGLSDEISAENGGIKIDTLFIDEGFGSLSDNYLENAIATIEKLSYENKFIGLISHVKEVKDAIEAKILVTYDKAQGSEVEIII